MYNRDDLDKEIAAKIDWLMQNNGPTLHPDWITTAIISDHPDVQGEDADFYLCCSRGEVRNAVRRQLNRFKTEAAPAQQNQLSLEGFERLQEYYLVARDGEQQAVRIDALTNDEIDAKCAELEQMSRGCLEHARELRRYREERTFRIQQMTLGQWMPPHSPAA